MKGAGFCLLYQEFCYIEICYIKIWVYYKMQKMFTFDLNLPEGTSSDFRFEVSFIFPFIFESEDFFATISSDSESFKVL